MTKNKKNLTPKLPPFANEAREGLLIVTMGAQADIEDEEGKRIHCHVRKNADPIITGDRIYWLPEQDGTGTIIGHAPRKSLLSRLENSQKQKLVAANIDAIIIVTAPFPPLSAEKIDRYLIAAENLNIPCIILLNKSESLFNFLEDRPRVYKLYFKLNERRQLKVIIDLLKAKRIVVRTIKILDRKLYKNIKLIKRKRF